MSVDKLLKYLKKYKVIKAKEGIEIIGSNTSFYRLAKSEVIKHLEPVNLGLFTLPDISEDEAYFSAIKRYYPYSVISNETALYLYDMGEFYSGKIHVDIPKTNDIKNSLIVAHRRDLKKITGVDQRAFKDKGITTKINIYTPERCLFEAYRHGADSDVYFRALKIYQNKYLNKTNPSIQYGVIGKIDQQFKSEILRDLMRDDVIV